MLKLQLGRDIPVMVNHIGSVEGYAGDRPWSTGLITAGAWREDSEDPVWHYSKNSPPVIQGGGIWPLLNIVTTSEPFVSTTHFWKADLGDSQSTDLAGWVDLISHDFLMTVPNAWTKFQKYYNPQRSWVLKYSTSGTGGVSTFDLYGGGTITYNWFGSLGFEYNSLVDLYKTGTAWIVGSYNSLGQWVDSNTRPDLYPRRVVFGQGWRDVFVWEILGRMCHLLGDMSVPTHAHNDMHGLSNAGIREDHYESYFLNANPYGGWDATKTYMDSGGLLNPYLYSNPLHFLMYTLNQISDHFNSNGPINQQGNNIIGGNYSVAEYNYLLGINITSLGEPQGTNFTFTDNNSENTRDKLLPLAIRYTAGLLYWFAVEAELIPNGTVILDVPGSFSTIQQAVNASTSGNTISVISGNHTLSSNIVLPPGVGISFQQNVNINLNGYYLKVNGAVHNDEGAVWLPSNITIKQGTAIQGHYSSIALALSNIVSGQLISMEAGSHLAGAPITIPQNITLSVNSNSNTYFSNNVIINGSLVTNGATLNFGSGSGLTVNGTLNATSTTFTGSGWSGINLNGANYPSLLYCNISNANYAINTTNCYSMIRNSRITGSVRGANYTTYGQGDIGPSCVFDWNDWDVRGDYNSVPSPGGSIAGYISFRNPGYFQVYSEYGGSIQAAGNYWSGIPLVTGNVITLNELPYDPNPRQTETGGIIASPEFKKSSVLKKSTKDNGITELDEARLLLETKNYESAMNKFKTVADKYYNETSGRIALVFMEQILDKTDRKTEKESLLSSYESKNGKLSTFAAYRKGYIHYKNGDYEKALEVFKNAKIAVDDDEMEKIRLYDMGTINYSCLDKKAEGLGYLNELVDKYPKDELSKLAITFYGAKKATEDKETEKMETKIISKTELLPNYPNPFNPTTIIKYNLAENTTVTLKVYDIMGREVKTLVSEFKPKGYYEVKFDGKGLSSGLYFYQLKAGNTNQMMKMILTK